MIQIIQNIKKIFKLECNHRFEKKDVVDLSIDPKCVYCNKTMSELTGGK